MKRLLVATFVALTIHTAQAQDDLARWQHEAANVTIIRDTWGIAHSFGHTDADAVFGMIYAQAEDDFNRVETNYINALGRAAEYEGEGAIWKDLRMKLFIDPDTLKALYARSPGFLQALMTAWADGLNFYLHTHPSVKPKVISRFEPWMALAFSEGSIGGDIERISLRGLESFYARGESRAGAGIDDEDEPTSLAEPSGSNGIAIAPEKSASKHAMLLINPHTSFFFRSELGMASDEGLHAYGASTWGQFFIYQGFNENVGWMHTSSNVDAIDEYAETIEKQGNGYVYRYGSETRPVTVSTIVVPYRAAAGGMATRAFTVYRTHHGPVVRSADGKWITVRLMNDPVHALTQSYTRTKARDYTEFRRTMDLHTNSSNNTIFASSGGDIVYFHANFIPKRDTSFDWSRPVDGSNPATEWGPVMSIDESPLVLNPPNGWVYNSNNAPWSAAGPYSPKRADYPRYVDLGGESFRGLHAIRVLQGRKTFTLEQLRAAAYDSYLTGFAALVPPLLRAYDALGASDSLHAKLADQIALLRAWDFRWGASSVPTSLAVFWGEELGRRVANDARAAGMPIDDYMVSRAADTARVAALSAATDTLVARFGSWRTPWGDINRFQRLTDDIEHPFSDAGPSIPVPFTSARWGSLASFGARSYKGSKKIYGTSGNSFVAVVEFGDSVRARAVTAGGESGDPASPHFNDQAQRYASGDLREVYFYRPQVRAHQERSYHPGQ
ncbi:MAG TPA: acylase [Gemmatimonadaceae bacterium]|nr:acylase [Gemmatimonadaceae bacterium]